MSHPDAHSIAQALVEMSKVIPARDFGKACDMALELLAQSGKADMQSFPGRVLAALEAQDNIVFASLTTPTGDSGELKDVLQKKIEKAIGRRVQLQEFKDESLIGGGILRIGDEMYDSSIRSDIDQLTEYLLAPLASEAN